MIPEKEVRICDLCGEYYPVVLADTDYKFTYLDKQMDLCNNCYDDITRMMKSKKPSKIYDMTQVHIFLLETQQPQIQALLLIDLHIYLEVANHTL